MIVHPYRGEGLARVQQLVQHYDPKFALDCYRDILRIRLIEEAIEARYHEDEMKTPIHLAIGEEAISVGTCKALRPRDQIFCGHRTHGHYLAKGGDLNAMFSELHCRINGCVGSRGGSMHLLDKSVGMLGSSAIVAGAVPIATGAALTAQVQQKDVVNVVYLGDAAVEEGVFWESINFAVLRKLPIIYVCNNNYFSVFSPIANRQPNHPIDKKVASFGLHTESVDGTNVFLVYEAMKRAVEYVKSQQGPAFIEAHVYRWRGHHGAGDDSHMGYRDIAELNQWQEVDPLLMLEKVLVEQKILNSSQLESMRTDINEEIAAAFVHALDSAHPMEADLYTHVYSE